MDHPYILETRNVNGNYFENKQRILHEFNLRRLLDIMLSRKTVREKFYPEPGYMFIPPYYIISGEFSRVISPLDCTAEYRYSKPLDTHLKQHRLIDVWTSTATYGDTQTIQVLRCDFGSDLRKDSHPRQQNYRNCRGRFVFGPFFNAHTSKAVCPVY